MPEAPHKMATSNSELSLVKLSQLRDKCNVLVMEKAWRKQMFGQREMQFQIETPYENCSSPQE